MRIQSSGLPYRCLGDLNADMKVVDFTVPFNPKPNKIKTTFKSLEDFNEVTCGLRKHSDLIRYASNL